MAKKWYCMFDETVRKEQPGFGFANSKNVACFDSLNEMRAAIADRYWDYSCKQILKKDAMKIAKDYDYKGSKVMAYNCFNFLENNIRIQELK